MNENEISYEIRRAIYEVYEELGPGFLESSYEFALKYELERTGLKVKSQVELPLRYKDLILQNAYKLDLLAENKVIIELKSVDAIHKVHHKQLISYLKLSDLKLGILVNFNTDFLKDNIFRKVNGL